MIVRISLSRNSRILVAAALASAALALMSTKVARADVDHQLSSVRVNFADLNPNTPRGSKLLYIRLRDAAENVCGNALDTVNLTERREIDHCQQAALKSAVARVDRPLLTSLYDQHFPHEPLSSGSRVSFAPGQPGAVRVEVVQVAPRRG